MKSQREQLIYMAGFFDGEGSIMLISQKRSAEGLPPYYKLTVSIGQKAIEPLEMFADRFGGTVYQLKNGYSQWLVTCQRAEAVVRALVPFLVLKQKQAQLALEFQDRRGTSFVKRTKKMVQWDEKARREMKKLNDRTPPKLRHY